MEMIPKLCDLDVEVFVGDIKPKPESFTNSDHYRQGDLNTLQKEFDLIKPDVLFIAQTRSK